MVEGMIGLFVFNYCFPSKAGRWMMLEFPSEVERR